MYIIKNALKSITRNKLRNILIGVIVLIISVSACAALSIQQAAEAAREDTLSSLNVTAQISFDRKKAMEEMSKNDDSDSDEGFDRGKFDFDVLQGSSLTLDDYMKYTKALTKSDGYYYSGAISLDATGDLIPYGTSEDSEDSDSKSSDSKENGNMPGQPPQMDSDSSKSFGMPFQVNQGDFSITGYSSSDAMLSMFGEDGSYKITDGSMFDFSSSDYECIISNELAAYNNLKVGDTIKLANPSYEKETYKLKITGIYTNSDSSSEENNRFRMNDPANNIYMSYKAFSKLIKASEKADNKTTDSDGNETSAVLSENMAFTYTFANVENYEKFSKKVYDLGLSDDYKVSSSDLQAYENSLTPLNTLSSTAMWFFFIVLGVGGIILITLNIFNLRERKYEVGVLTAIGMKKAKVALQFITEIFIVTMIAMIIGSSIGSAVSVPLTNTLLANQISSSQSSQDKVNDNFGFKNDKSDSGMSEPPQDFGRVSSAVKYVDSVSSASNIFVILELALVGLFLILISGLAALVSIMRYEPLKILSNRS